MRCGCAFARVSDSYNVLNLQSSSRDTSDDSRWRAAQMLNCASMHKCSMHGFRPFKAKPVSKTHVPTMSIRCPTVGSSSHQTSETTSLPLSRPDHMPRIRAIDGFAYCCPHCDRPAVVDFKFFKEKTNQHRKNCPLPIQHSIHAASRGEHGVRSWVQKKREQRKRKKEKEAEAAAAALAPPAPQLSPPAQGPQPSLTRLWPAASSGRHGMSVWSL